MTRTRNVAILLFDGMEAMDVCGPFEVFSVADELSPAHPFDTYTVAETLEPVLGVHRRFSLNPNYTLETCPPPDLLIVPGGVGARQQMQNQAVLDWIGRCAVGGELILSVCTGALLLAKARLLDGLAATTHHELLGLLREIAPQTTVYDDRRFVDNGTIMTSAGISAGIDLSLHVVARLLGHDAAAHTAAYMEYDWRFDAQPT